MLILNSISNLISYFSVILSLSLLFGAKVLNVCVPFMFKGAVDSLNVLSMDTPVDATLAVTTSLLLGCKKYISVIFFYRNPLKLIKIF